VRGLNRLGLNLPSEILSVHKKESADCNQFEEPHALLILALYYKEKLVQHYGPVRTEELLNRYRTMDYAKSDVLKKERIAAKQHAEERRNLKLKLIAEAGKRADERIQQRNREQDLEKKRLELDEKRLTQQPDQSKPAISEAERKCRAEGLLEKPVILR
jgi:hypothetical protein